MDIRTTAKIKIQTSPYIVKTLSIYRKGLQLCVDAAWQNKVKHAFKLQPLVYKKLKEFGLQAQLAITCIRQACGMVKKAKTKPKINKVSMRYNFPRSASIKNNVLSIATVDGRVKIPFTMPECYKEYFSWDIKESLLNIYKGKCYFLFTFAKEVHSEGSDVQSEFLGVDLGVNTLAVTSDKRFYGKRIKQLRVKRDKLVSQLQAKGTKSAKRKLKKLSGKWRRFMSWVNHNISKDIVGSTKKTIVMEDLSMIRNNARYNPWVHKWAFRQLQSFIDYKAVRKGSRVVYINPAYTSKECSVCHNHATRHAGFVQCPVCGYSLHSDLNASRNIAQRYMRNMCSGLVTAPNVSCDDSKTNLMELRMSTGTKSTAL